MSVKEYITKINETGNSYLAEVKEHACAAALTEPQQCVDFINQAFDAAHLSEEHFYVIATDTKSKPIAVFDVAHGVIDGAYVQPREVLVRLLLCGASSAILLHNHPSGCSDFSKDDLEVTKQMHAAFELIGMKLSDHIIIGRDNYYSFCQHTLLSRQHQKE